MNSYNTDKSTRYRDWTITLFDKPDVDTLINSKKFRYFIIGEEICPTTNKLHYQCYFYYKNACNFDSVKKLFPTAHIEARYSTPNQASEYCKKDNKFIEWGNLPIKGQRHDLDNLKDEIMSGNKTVDDITIDTPINYHQYGRTLEKIQSIYYRNNLRTFLTKGIWIYGETGSGKTLSLTWIKKMFNSVFYHRDNNGWWDGYSQQELVVINEFRGNIQFSHLLDLIDYFEGAKVPIRGKEPIPFNSKCIVITSALPPDEVFKNLSSRDTIDQLYRRIKVFELPLEKNTFKNDIIEYINEPYKQTL